MVDWQAPADLDSECLSLCRALNAMPGITTVSSCCGHGGRPFTIWFIADSLEALPAVAYWFDACHSGERGWTIVASTDCAMSPIMFAVEGPAGAVAAADVIAAFIKTPTAEPC